MKFRSLPSKSLLFHLSSSSYTARSRVLVTNFQFSTTSGSSSCSGSGSSHSALKRAQYEEASRSVRVSVWWDFEKCNIPAGANVFRVAQLITGAIRSSGIKGPITITGFGDVLQLPRSNQEALSATGISLTHVPQGGKNSADRSLMTDLMCWVSQNPPPAHLFLISSDKDFASVLHRLRMSNYNILLASDSSAPGVLCSAASIMWDWDGLIKGENVSGKYFNQPPDGPYNSWYGHYRTALLDPFATNVEQSSSVKAVEVLESGSSSDSVKVGLVSKEVSESGSSLESVKVRPVPKEIVKRIRLIVSLYPNGAPISELYDEMMKSTLVIDKDFYGHKSFSRFLQSMPDILQVDAASDGSFVVRVVTEKTTPTQLDSSTDLSTVVGQKAKDKEAATVSSPKVISNVDIATDSGRDELLGRNQDKVMGNGKHVKKESPENTQESIAISQKDVKANNKPKDVNQLAVVAGRDSSMEDGFFQSLKRLWYGSPQLESEHLPENKSASASEDKDEGVGKDGKAEDKGLKFSSQGTNPMSQNSPFFAGESVEEVKAGTDEVDNKDKNASPGFFSQLLKNFKFWERNKDSSGDQKLVNVDSQVHDIFAKDSFWSDVESFINSPRGFVIVSHSRTREMIAKNLQRDGPSCLRLLDESSMLRLVTLLISEKKWIEENPSSSVPFSIIKGSSSSPSHHPASNGLSSIFSDSSKLQSQKQDIEKKYIAHTGVSTSSVDRKQQEKYRSNAIVDCQKLIKKFTEKHPEGYSLIRFRKEFLEEYGYHLAVDKLGYGSLQSLIQATPGVRVASGYIFPSTTSSDAKSRNKDNSDLSFEELGPVSTPTANNPTTKKTPVYEPSLSEDDDSDLEIDIPKTKKKQEMKRDYNESSSSLMEILDSYYTSKDGEDKKEKVEERKLVKNTSKQKPSKAYSFVKDSEV